MPQRGQAMLSAKFWASRKLADLPGFHLSPEGFSAGIGGA